MAIEHMHLYHYADKHNVGVEYQQTLQVNSLLRHE